MGPKSIHTRFNAPRKGVVSPSIQFNLKLLNDKTKQKPPYKQAICTEEVQMLEHIIIQVNEAFSYTYQHEIGVWINDEYYTRMIMVVMILNCTYTKRLYTYVFLICVSVFNKT